MSETVNIGMECKCEQPSDYGDDVGVMNQLVNMISMRKYHIVNLPTRVVKRTATTTMMMLLRLCLAVGSRNAREAILVKDLLQNMSVHMGVKACCVCKHCADKLERGVEAESNDELLIIYKSCGFQHDEEACVWGWIDILTVISSAQHTWRNRDQQRSEGWERIIYFYLSDFDFSLLPQDREDGENEIARKKNRRTKTNEKWFSTPWNTAFVHESGAREAPTKPKSMWHKQMFVIFFFVKLFNKVFFIFTHRKVSEWKSSHKLIPNCGADERNESEGGKRKSL